MYNLFYYKVYGKDRQHEKESVPGSVSVYTADLYRVPVFGHVLWIYDAEHRIFFCVSAVYEYVHLCRLHGMCDESFSINCTVTPPEDVDKGWFMFFVTLLNHLYWVCGATAGALLGYVIHFDTTGIEFVMTALFVVMFMGQWEEHPDHRPALIGLVIPIVCLFVFGSQNFIIPSMALIIVCFMALKKYLQPEVKE